MSKLIPIPLKHFMHSTPVEGRNFDTFLEWFFEHFRDSTFVVLDDICQGVTQVVEMPQSNRMFIYSLGRAMNDRIVEEHVFSIPIRAFPFTEPHAGKGFQVACHLERLLERRGTTGIYLIQTTDESLRFLSEWYWIRSSTRRNEPVGERPWTCFLFQGGGNLELPAGESWMVLDFNNMISFIDPLENGWVRPCITAK